LNEKNNPKPIGVQRGTQSLEVLNSGRYSGLKYLPKTWSKRNGDRRGDLLEDWLTWEDLTNEAVLLVGRCAAQTGLGH
jgi:hypothetical protein